VAAPATALDWIFLATFSLGVSLTLIVLFVGARSFGRGVQRRLGSRPI
jgi:hypothetical protein